MNYFVTYLLKPLIQVCHFKRSTFRRPAVPKILLVQCGTGSYSDRRYSDKYFSDKRYSDSSLTLTLTRKWTCLQSAQCRCLGYGRLTEMCVSNESTVCIIGLVVRVARQNSACRNRNHLPVQWRSLLSILCLWTAPTCCACNCNLSGCT